MVASWRKMWRKQVYLEGEATKKRQQITESEPGKEANCERTAVDGGKVLVGGLVVCSLCGSGTVGTAPPHHASHACRIPTKTSQN